VWDRTQFQIPARSQILPLAVILIDTREFNKSTQQIKPLDLLYDGQ
jgi:hypothetical protein